MPFFNVIASRELGARNDVLHQDANYSSQAPISINTNVLTGNLVVNDFCKTLVVQGFKFDIGMVYNSMGLPRWQINQTQKILNVEPNVGLTVKRGDGSEAVYKFDTTRQCYSYFDASDGLQTLRFQDGVWVGENIGSGTAETYDEALQLKTKTDQYGRKLHFEYDETHRLKAIKGATDPHLEFVYEDGHIQLYFVVDERKTLWMDYVFEGDKLTKSMIATDGISNYAIDYSYDDGLLTSISEQNGKKVQVTYDANRKIKSIQNTAEHYQFDYDKDKTRLTDAANHTTLYQHNEQGQLGAIDDAHRSLNFTYDDHGRVHQSQYLDGTRKIFTYNDQGLLAQKINRAGDNTDYIYDARGLLLTKTQYLVRNGQSIPQTTYYSYNEKKECVFQISPKGKVTGFEYDANSNCIAERVYLANLFDTKTLHLPIDPSIISYWCDRQDKSKVQLTSFWHNKYGQITDRRMYSEVDAKGNGINNAQMLHEEYGWDSQDRLLRKAKRADTLITTEHHYDGLNRLINALDEGERFKTYDYNGQKLTIRDNRSPLEVAKFFDTSGRITERHRTDGIITKKESYQYDRAGHLAILTSPENKKRYSLYDVFGRLQFSIDQAGFVVENKYDANDHITQAIKYSEPELSIDDEAVLARKFVPERRGKVHVEERIYDVENHLRFVVDGEGYVKELTYDSLGHLCATIQYANRIEHPFAEDKIKKDPSDSKRRYFYDEDGHLIAEQNALGQVTVLKRNSAGFLIQKIEHKVSESLNDPINLNALKSSPADAHYDYQNDARGNCVLEVNPLKEETSHAYDGINRKIQTTQGDQVTSFKYDAFSRLIKKENAPGLIEQTTYDLCGEVSRKEMQDTKDGLSRSKLCRYNAFGELTHEISQRIADKMRILGDDQAAIEALWEQASTRYFYNNDQLKIKSIDPNNHANYFYYDNRGQLVFKIDALGFVTEFSYDAFNESPIAKRFYAKPLSDTYYQTLIGGYVNDALMACIHQLQTESDECIRISYDARGLPIEIIDGEDRKCTKVYDAFGKMREEIKTIDEHKSRIDRFYYDALGRSTITQRDVNALNVVDKKSYEDETGRVVETDPNGFVFFHQLDLLGREVLIKTDAKTLKETKYDALSRPTMTKDAEDQITSISYPDFGRKTEIKSPLGNVTTIEKNAFGEVVKETTNNSTVSLSYGVDGQLEEKIDQQGQRERKIYDDLGRLEREIDANNIETAFEYDELNRVAAKVQDAKGMKHRTTYAYDMKGRTLDERDANGILTKKTYDHSGLPTQITFDAEGACLTKDLQYDGLGHLLLKRTSIANHRDQFSEAVQCDALGRVQSITVDPNGLKLRTRNFYDQAGNLTKIIDPKGNVTLLFYDAFNRERYRVDARFGVKEKYYDANGLLVENREYSDFYPQIKEEMSLSDVYSMVRKSDRYKATYAKYDADRRLIASIDQKDLYRAYKYNSAGKKIYEHQYATPRKSHDFHILPAASDSDRRLAWFYDHCNRERFSIDGEGTVTEKRYDERGLLVLEKTYARPYFDYDHCPDAAQIIDAADRSTHYIYDSLGRMIFEIDGEGYVTVYDYEITSAKPSAISTYQERIRVPEVVNAETIKTLINPIEHSKVLIKSIQYDGLGRRTHESDGLKFSESYQYDAKDNVRLFKDKEGYEWRTEYDGANRKVLEITPEVPIAYVNQAEGAKDLAVNSHVAPIVKKIVYDEASNIVSLSEAFGSPEERNSHFTYDACNNLETEAHLALVDELTNQPENIDDDFVMVDEKDEITTDEFVLLEKSLVEKPVLTPKRPDDIRAVETHVVRNAEHQPIVKINEGGYPQFNIYGEDGLLRYQVDQAGYVTGYEYNVFGEKITILRYENKLPFSVRDYQTTGISIDAVKAHVEKDRYRKIAKSYDRAGRVSLIQQMESFYYLPKADGTHQSGKAIPKTRMMHNAFGERILLEHLLDPINDTWVSEQTWYNRLGHVIAEKDRGNFVNLYTLNPNGKRLIAYELSQPLNHNVTKDATYDALCNATNALKNDCDRITSYRYNVRDDLIKMIKHHVQLDGISNDKILEDLETTYEIDSNGRVIKITLPNGQTQSVTYDARGLQVQNTGVAVAVCDDHGNSINVNPITENGYNYHGQLAQTVKYGSPVNPTDASRYTVLKAMNLNLHDPAGMMIASRDANGNVHYQSFTQTKKKAREWLWVTGWNDLKQKIYRLHETQTRYNVQDLPIYTMAQVVGGGVYETYTKWNGYGEKIVEGNAEYNLPAYFGHDENGKLTHFQIKGKPAIKLYDLMGRETGLLQSRQQSLKNANPVDLMALDYSKLKRTEIVRDEKGSIIEQRYPSFKTIPEGEPEPYESILTSGPLNIQFGKYSITWPESDLKALEKVIFKLWPVGKPDQTTELPVQKIGQTLGVNTEQLPTNRYEFQIDYYHKSEITNQIEHAPRYRTKGCAIVMTDISVPIDTYVWELIDDDVRLCISGNTEGMEGVELLEKGKVIGFFPLQDSSDSHKKIIDFSSAISGVYDFRFKGPAFNDELESTITIHTPQWRANHIIGKEIRLEDVSCTTVVYPVMPWWSGVTSYWRLGHDHNHDCALFFQKYNQRIDWKISGGLNNAELLAQVKLNVLNDFMKGNAGQFPTLTRMVAHTTTDNFPPYGEAMIHDHRYRLPYNFDVQSVLEAFSVIGLDLSINIDDRYAPLLHAGPAASFDRAVYDRDGRKETFVSHYQPTTTLWLYPLTSAMVSSIQLEYLDISLPTPLWRPINATATRLGYAVPVDTLPAGHIPFRIKGFSGTNPVDLSGLVDRVEDGWGVFTSEIRHGAKHAHVHHTKVKQAVLTPTEQWQRDRYNNIQKHTNLAGHTTDFIVNNANEVLREVLPEITITDEHGTQSRTRPTTSYKRNKDQGVIAVKDANGNFTYHERDSDGHVLKTTNADQNSKQFTYDVFRNCRRIRDAFSNDTILLYDLNGNETFNQDPNGWVKTYDHNELNLRISANVGKNRATTYYDYLEPNQIVTDTILPEGQRTKVSRDHNGLMARQTLADGRSMIWENDYFGNQLNYTDLGGVKYIYEHNPYADEIISIRSSGASSRRTSDGSQPNPQEQNLRFEFDEASQNIVIVDDALNLKTFYRNDKAMRRWRETFIGSDGHYHQAVSSRWNEAGWLVGLDDTVMQVDYGHDAKGNRRYTKPAIYWDNEWYVRDQCFNWYKYEADNIVINQGYLDPSDHEIKIKANKGTQLIYDHGRRSQEISIDDKGNVNTKTLHYLPNSLLSGFENSNQTGNYQFEHYNETPIRNKMKRSGLRKEDNKYEEVTQVSKINGNGWTYEQVVDSMVQVHRHEREESRSTTQFDLDPLGQTKGQHTKFEVKDEDKKYRLVSQDELTTAYEAFDHDKVIRNAGKRKLKTGEESPLCVVEASYDANSAPAKVMGEIRPESYREFLLNSENRIVEKKTAAGQLEHYFYTTIDKEIVGHFGNVPDPMQLGSRGLPPNIDFDLNVHAVSDHFPPPTPDQALVLAHDTFADIAERTYGDRSFARLIAVANGFRADEAPPCGMTLQIPNIVGNKRNWEGIYPVYHERDIVGPLQPNLTTPHHKQKRPNLWHIALEAAIGAFVMSLSAGMFMALLPDVLQLVAYGLAGALSNLASQEAAVELGDQDHVSGKNVLKSAMLSAETSGIAQILGIDINQAISSEKFLIAAKQGGELALALQTLRSITGENKHFDWKQVVASAVQSGANAVVSGNGFGDVENLVIDTAIAEAENDFKNPEAIAANAIGTFVGNQLGKGVQNKIAEIQAERAAEQEAADEIKQGIINQLPTYKRDYSLTTDDSSPINPTPTKPNKPNQKKAANDTLNKGDTSKVSFLNNQCRWQNQKQLPAKNWSDIPSGAVSDELQKLESSSTSTIPLMQGLGSKLAANYTSPAEWSSASIEKLGSVAESMHTDYKDLEMYASTRAKQALDAPVLDVMAAETGSDIGFKISQIESENAANYQLNGIKLSKFSVFAKRAITTLDIIDKSMDVVHAPKGQKMKTAFEKSMEFAGEGVGVAVGGVVAGSLAILSDGLSLVATPGIVVGTSTTGGYLFGELAKLIEKGTEIEYEYFTNKMKR